MYEARADRFASEFEATLTGPGTVVREPEEVERLWSSFSKGSTMIRRLATKPNEASFIRVNSQTKLTQSDLELLQIILSIGLV